MKTNLDDILFGIKAQRTISQFGTRDDVKSFFVVIDRLIEQGRLKGHYDMVTHNLFRSCIDPSNVELFAEQIGEICEVFKNTPKEQVNWSSIPMSRKFKEQRINRLSLFDVFKGFFDIFFRYIELQPVALEEGFTILPMFIIPTDISLSQKYIKMTPKDFAAQADDPLWLREPIDWRPIEVITLDGKMSS